MNAFFSDPITLVVAVCVVNMLLVIGMICLLYRCKNLERSNLIMRAEVEVLQIDNDKLENEIESLRDKNRALWREMKKEIAEEINNNPFEILLNEFKNKKIGVTISVDSVSVDSVKEKE